MTKHRLQTKKLKKYRRAERYFQLNLDNPNVPAAEHQIPVLEPFSRMSTQRW